jgi:hypothetical protein
MDEWVCDGSNKERKKWVCQRNKNELINE